MMITGKELGLHMKDHSAPLVELLQKHISLNLSRAKCLGLFIISMLNSRTVQLVRWIQLLSLIFQYPKMIK
ncbi:MULTISPECIES: hypothetical protein [spotted fever group]|uniref:Uncharacterized protein n=1 Tax=Rickettsia tamurae subsp. buchneri TaxID=1462938 RepID=A0A8E0WLY6_9RICK|nr:MULTISPECIES: hypothetical protein [spotted fever group]EER21527.1 hypothetical protein REIS_0681 [Rickettsia endosymbiont of Ixodes scapularis]KDO02712.1 hypothetical protein REISMN_05460 [Rickettsia tamurae subsp. buchneri]